MKYLLIYLVIGFVYAWMTVEVGNAEAKREGKSFWQYHQDLVDDHVEGPAGDLLKNLWFIFTFIMVFWWIFLAAYLFKKKGK